MSDFLVIGGGIAGLALGARLSELGQVTVIEAEESCGYHSSGRSAALYEASYGPPAAVALAGASRGEFDASGDILSPRGLMLVGLKGEEARLAADTAAMKLEPLSPEEGRAMVPVLALDRIAGLAFHADAWDIDTDLMLQRNQRRIRRNGGRVVTGARAGAILRGSRGWTVETAAGVQRGLILVNAAGAWADTVAGLAGVRRLGITPHRRSIAVVPAPAGHNIDRWPMLLGTGESWYAKPQAGRLLISPADAEPVEPGDVWADELVLAEGIARYDRAVTEPVRRIERNWAGLRSFTADRNPAIGFDRERPDFFWYAGFGGFGFQTAPAASRLAAELIGGRAASLPAEVRGAVDPARLG